MSDTDSPNNELVDLAGAWDVLAHAELDRTLGVTTRPVPISLARDVEGRALLTIASSERPPTMPALQGFHSRCLHRDDGYRPWLLVIGAAPETDTQRFLWLATQLVRRAMSSRTEDEAFRAVARELEALRDMFAMAGTDLLSESVLQGLFGELVLLRDVLGPAIGIDQAVLSWDGPWGAANDFSPPGEVAVEVKSARPSAKAIKISSLEQLDPDHNRDLMLAVVRLARVSPNDDRGEAITDLVDSIAESALHNPRSRERFFEALGSVRFDRTRQEYTDFAWQVEGAPHWYPVVGDFPRLRRSQIPESISRAQYDLTIATLDEWSVDQASAVERLVARNG